MWFRNLTVYRIGGAWRISADDFEEHLAAVRIQPCGRFSTESRGWVFPRNEERYLYTLNRQWLFALGFDQKILPASVVRQATDERAAAVAKKLGHPVGRKHRAEIREQVLEELLPRALVRRRVTRAWIDTVNGWLAIDTPADKKADEVTELLRKTHERLPPLTPLSARRPAGSSMTRWLASGKAPRGFSIDQDLELQSPDHARSFIRYVHHALEGREIRDHIAAGKTVTRVGMTWKDRLSFVLTEKLQVKRLTFLDVLKEEDSAQAADEEEQHDLDFALMTGELAQFLTDLVEVLGGEAQPQAAESRRAV